MGSEVHKQQLADKSKAKVHPKRADQKKITQFKKVSSQGRQRSLQCYHCQGSGHRQSECGTKISLSKDQKGSSTPVSQGSKKKMRVMVADIHARMFKKKCNQEKTEKSALKERHSEETSPAQGK